MTTPTSGHRFPRYTLEDLPRMVEAEAAFRAAGDTDAAEAVARNIERVKRGSR